VYSERIDLNWQVRAKGRKVRIKADVADCAALPNVDTVSCVAGGCVIGKFSAHYPFIIHYL
jgi:hypothetical protein